MYLNLVSFSINSNIAEALVSKGLGTCVKHGRNDDQRSSHYDDLLSAENRAIKNKKGVHGKKETSMHRVADVSGVRKELIGRVIVNKNIIFC